jgi:hypothetical protein
MPCGIHAAMKSLKPRASQSVLDRIRAGTGLEQLGAGDHAVLLRREPSDELIELDPIEADDRSSWHEFAAYVAGFSGHERIVARTPSRISTRL